MVRIRHQRFVSPLQKLPTVHARHGPRHTTKLPTLTTTGNDWPLRICTRPYTTRLQTSACAQHINMSVHCSAAVLRKRAPAPAAASIHLCNVYSREANIGRQLVRSKRQVLCCERERDSGPAGGVGPSRGTLRGTVPTRRGIEGTCSGHRRAPDAT